MQVDLYNTTGNVIGTTNLPERVFGVKVNHDLIYQAVKTQRDNARQSIAHTKGRGEVRGGGIKPWRQKGTGRARHGSIRSPIWKGGGVAFGPTKERNFSKKINKKMQRLALFMVLSSKAKDQQLAVVDHLLLEDFKTKQAVAMVNALAIGAFKNYKKTKTKQDSVLAIVQAKDVKTEKSFANLPFTSVIEARNLNPLEILNHKFLLLTEDAVAKIDQTFK